MKQTIAAVIALTFLATACSKVSTGASSAGERANSFTQPHVLRFADAGDINTLNPHLGQFTAVGHIGSLVMAWLIKFDEHNNAYPELATEIPTQANGGVSKDGLTITYHIRRGVKWADGVPFDADDVVFSTNVVNNLANNEVGRQGWDQIARIDEPDKFTVIYHLKKPYSPFIETFFSTAGANPCILPKHLLAQYPNINNVPYNSKPVGIGPFKVDRWDRSQQVVLVANPLYFRGRPKLEKIVYKIIPDRNTVLAQLQSKEIDMWDLATANYYPRLQGLTGYNAVLHPSYYWDHIDMNMTHPGLSDPAVREAMRIGLNRKEQNDKIAHGVFLLSDSPTPYGAPYEVKVPLVPYDAERASALLDRAGWKLGPDGVRAKNGTRLSFNLATTAGSQDADNRIELFRADWKKIGIAISVQHYPPAMMFAPLQQGGIVYGNKWDLIIFAWQNEAIGDYSQIYGCDAFPPLGQNDPRWCNKSADAAMHALYDDYEQPARNADVATFVRAFVKDAPVIIEDQRQDIYAVNKDLKNFNPNSITPFDNFMDVDI
ncbi:MAG: peptide ABC transporter substrate-binding protein [Candidatus Eremiobacteraeota bacterium]|nr:peptide ABC transporter substrate-binding protein [Candidatus Eremiobacteraeota bacterium]